MPARNERPDRPDRPARRRPGALLALIAPGLLVAATGVGAGDLATAGFAGMKLGAAVLWAVALGAIFKFVLTEGIARWQIATGQTVLEGAASRLGRLVPALFLLYFLPWSYFTAAALMSGAGVASHAILPVFDDPAHDKILYGSALSIAALALVWFGGFRLFERIMGACIALMFVTVVVTATLVGPDLPEVFRGLAFPTIPDPGDGRGGEGLTWTIALIGGVGGTVTILCYGYWIREVGRTSRDDLSACRIDLAVGYTFTALFGMAMILIAQGADEPGKGAALLVRLADHIGAAAGSGPKWLFLLGAWAAIFSSVLGVWQAVPYIFADTWLVLRRRSPDEPAKAVSTTSLPYRGFLVALAVVPILGLLTSFERAQLAYTITGAAFLPLLAIVLLVLNTRSAWVGRRFRSGPWGVIALLVTLAFFAWAGWTKSAELLTREPATAAPAPTATPDASATPG